MDMDMKSMNSLKSNLVAEKMSQGDYKCCLENPCTYCLIKEGSCDCLAEVMAGEHPCGECIGEILEGNGNHFLAEYFARAIADETGEHDALKRIIAEKYNVSIEIQK